MEQELKHAVLMQLHAGRDKAISGELLANRLGMKGTRTIRLAIRDLIADGVAISGSSRPPYGYFIASTAEEAEEELKVLRHYAMEAFLRRRDYKRAARKLLQPHQMHLI